ncbi:hypothetical protein cand_029420 [Cryptosporidium andersoni]|uniref:Uncharacterized protein n=1 Tax=Cryptosporidium andersoni TaxID=117008 RepID=A0A1J4MN85_9CRYT|nr:hypothetical protein cand_029420 [Cryptosporidium andersoni]
MQNFTTAGQIPHLVSPNLLMISPNKARSSKKRSNQSSCSACGRCCGSIAIIMFAVIAVSCCYALPIYSALMNSKYYDSYEEPIWNWSIVLSGIQYIKNLLPDKEAIFSKNDINNTTMRTLVEVTDVSNETIDITRDHTTREAANFSSIDYFREDLCQKNNSTWSKHCNYDNKITTFECIDMLRGPTVCIGIRNGRYNIFLVPNACKLVEPPLPVEIIPSIADGCVVDSKNPSICPCYIVAAPVTKLIDVMIDLHRTIPKKITELDFINAGTNLRGRALNEFTQWLENIKIEFLDWIKNLELRGGTTPTTTSTQTTTNKLQAVDSKINSAIGTVDGILSSLGGLVTNIRGFIRPTIQRKVS